MNAVKKGLFPVLIACALTAFGSAQQQLPPGSRTGNPTPGTPQPDPPNLADRVTLVGCVQLAAGAPARRTDSNNPTDGRFVLEKAERKRVVPPNTGTSSTAAAATDGSYRLRAIDSQLSPFVGTKVEVSGEIVAATPGGAAAPTVQVEFVQKVSSTCS